MDWGCWRCHEPSQDQHQNVWPLSETGSNCRQQPPDRAGKERLTVPFGSEWRPLPMRLSALYVCKQTPPSSRNQKRATYAKVMHASFVNQEET